MTKMTAPAKALVVALAFPALLLAGCNTISGAGQDVSAAGSAIDREARQAAPY